MSCYTPKGLMPIEQALNTLLDDVVIQEQVELMQITEALGYVIAEDVISQINVPPCDNSAMDGYALNINQSWSEGLTVSQRIAAGSFPEPLAEGTTARIFTGAAIPDGANAVVMQEQCVEKEGVINFPEDIKLMQNIRPMGQDIQSGAVVLGKGARIRPQDLGLLASIGIEKVAVYKRLKIAILSTGDELLEPGDTPQPGKIYNSNRYALLGMLQALRVDYIDLGVVHDTLEATTTSLSKAVSLADMVITTGGVSAGAEDHVKTALSELGHIDLWRLAIKPGKPLAYGKIANKAILCLPGNPAAAFVTFCIIARPYILKKQGATNYLPSIQHAKSTFTWPQSKQRQEYLRGRLCSEAGNTQVSLYPNQSSGVLTSVSWADALIIVPVGESVSVGDSVSFYSLSELLN